MDLLPYLLVSGLLIITPGPDMALVTRNAVAYGQRAALVTMLGIETGLIVWTAAAVLGVAALLQTSAALFGAVKLAGAAYLVYLGARTLLGLLKPTSQTEASAPAGSPFREGLLSNLLNPKIAVFFTSLIPQFVTPGPEAAGQSVVLGALYVLMGLVWLTAYALVASSAGAALRRGRVRRLLDGITGTVLVGFGLRLATDQR
jgi:RhtB (resistance to homoserine/threonine) family protein